MNSGDDSKRVSEPVKPGANNAQDWAAVGRRLFEQRCYPDSLVAFENAIRDGFNSQTVLLCAATAALYSGSLDRTDYFTKAVLVTDPYEPTALALKGIVALKSERYAEAHNYFSLALRLKPSSTVIKKYLDQTSQKLDHTSRTSAPSSPQQQTEPLQKKFNRKYRRARVEGCLQIQDFATSSFLALPISSLSAGGCLVKAMDVPESFYFVLNLKGCQGVTGLGKKIYQSPQTGTGIRFVELPINAADSIERIVRRIV